MNAFADWLFSIFLGWTKGLVNAGWNMVANHAGGLSDFLGRIWLPLLIALLVGGTAIDYIVWFVRWRPHHTWRKHRVQQQHAQRNWQAAQALEQTDMPEDYLNMMSGWVQENEESMPLPEDLYADPVPQYEARPEPVYPAQPLPEASVPDINIAWRPASGAAPQPQPAPMQEWPADVPEHPGYPEDMPVPAVRRRRADRKRGILHKLSDLRETLRPQEEDDGDEALPETTAFREPVYPPNYYYEEPAPRDNRLPRND